MEINENLVTEEVTEKVETVATEETAGQAAETETQPAEPEKIYSEEEFRQMFDEGVKKKLGRSEAKLRKEYDSQYGGLLSVLRKATGLESVEDLTKSFREYYEGQGVTFTQEAPKFSDKETEILARAEADEIISAGDEEVIEEAHRLEKLGFENMSSRDKAVYLKLHDHITKTEDAREFAKIGVSEQEYTSEEFKAFAEMFKGSKTPKTKIYEIYLHTKPPKNIKPMGSVESTVQDDGVKDYYSYEAASKFTKKDLDENPKLYKAILNSMTKWK